MQRAIAGNVIMSRALPAIKHAIRVPAHPIIKWLTRFLPVTPYVELAPEEITHVVRIGNMYHVSPAAYLKLQSEAP